MGMYNEVFAPCPRCGTTAEMQIPQVVLGFGGFHLNDPSSMEDLARSEKIELAEYVNDRSFHCEGCEHNFSVDVEVSVGTKRYTI